MVETQREFAFSRCEPPWPRSSPSDAFELFRAEHTRTLFVQPAVQARFQFRQLRHESAAKRLPPCIVATLGAFVLDVSTSSDNKASVSDLAMPSGSKPNRSSSMRGGPGRSRNGTPCRRFPFPRGIAICSVLRGFPEDAVSLFGKAKSSSRCGDTRHAIASCSRQSATFLRSKLKQPTTQQSASRRDRRDSRPKLGLETARFVAQALISRGGRI